MIIRYYFVYIVSNKHRTTFYIGVTNNLFRRVTDHRNGVGSKFTAKYKLKDLVYYEVHTNISGAIQREKQLKNWHRQWKINLIKSENPEMVDLYESELLDK